MKTIKKSWMSWLLFSVFLCASTESLAGNCIGTGAVKCADNGGYYSCKCEMKYTGWYATYECNFDTSYATPCGDNAICNTAAQLVANACVPKSDPDGEQPGGAIPSLDCKPQNQGKITCTTTLGQEGYKWCFCEVGGSCSWKPGQLPVPCPNGTICNKAASGIGNACIASSTSGTNNATVDTDNDGLNDVDELKYGTNPNNADTDSDGALDGDEVKKGTNPLVSEAAIMAAVSLLIADDDTESILNYPMTYPASVIILIPALTSDKDGDSIVDILDNCPTVTNKDQKDSNKNGTGDACEMPLWYKIFGGKWLCKFIKPTPAWCTK